MSVLSSVLINAFKATADDHQASAVTDAPNTAPLTTAAPVVATTTVASSLFDPASQTLSLNLSDCPLKELSHFDAFSLYSLVEGKMTDSCLLSGLVANDLSAANSSTCRFTFSVPEEADLQKLQDCFSGDSALTIDYMAATHVLTLPTDLIATAIDAMDDGVSQRLEAGLDASLINDSSVVYVLMSQKYSEVLNSFDTVLEDMTALTQSIFTIVGDVEVVSIKEDATTGQLAVGLRPIAKNGTEEASILNQLKGYVSDPLSAINLLPQIYKTTTTTTTTPPTTTTTKPATTTTAAPSSTQSEEGGINVPLVGGLVGGIGGLAVVLGAGGFLYAKKGSKKGPVVPVDKDDDDRTPMVLTPNTRHGQEGLVERTPRSTPSNAQF